MREMVPRQKNDAIQALQGVFDRPGLERGLYVACGKSDLVPMVLNLLVRRLDRTHRLSSAGHSPIERLGASSSAPIGPLMWVDSGNSFDAYQMARAARRHGMDPHWALRSIRVARPFTAFQLSEMIRKIPDGGNPPVVIVSDLMGLFLDSELKNSDADRAFQNFRQALMELQRRAIVIALYRERPSPPSRSSYLPVLLGMARRVFTPLETARRPRAVVRVKRAAKFAQKNLISLTLPVGIKRAIHAVTARWRGWVPDGDRRRWAPTRRRFQWANPVMIAGRHG